MSSKVKQANFRLPLDYMSMIDDFAQRENITKAAVITRALDCMQASYDSGNGGMPVTGAAGGASDEEINELKAKLKEAEERAASAERARDAAEQRANDAVLARDAAEIRARDAASSQATAASAAGADAVELERLKALVAQQEATLDERNRALAAKEAAIAERDARITSLSEQLGVANAKAQLVNTATVMGAAPAVMEGGGSPGEDSTRALAMLNMLGGVMGAFQQQVDDARQVGEQEGREAVQKEFEDMINRARNDGYREAMNYLDDRVTTARESGAKEERARIANMGFFERRRYLKVHLT